MDKMIDTFEGLQFNSTPDNNKFANDILEGLSHIHKNIPSKYFYDAYGSELFNKITRHPDYYLTNCELMILKKYTHELSALMKNTAFNLIELGPGEALKTRILIKKFLDDGLIFRYVPVDISKKYDLSYQTL